MKVREIERERERGRETENEREREERERYYVDCRKSERKNNNINNI
jgi:hypothetical protein